AVVEALWAGLPLMLSDRVGNCFEALMPGENGWLFKAESSTSIKACLESWRAADDRVLSTFGGSSSKIAEERLETSRVVESFLNEIISVLSAERSTPKGVEERSPGLPSAATLGAVPNDDATAKGL